MSSNDLKIETHREGYGMQRAKLGDMIDALSTATDLGVAAQSIIAIGHALGLDRPAIVEDFTGKDFMKTGPWGELFGWRPSQVYDHGGPSLHRVCPIGRACRITASPFSWRATEIGTAKVAWDPRSQEFWRRAAQQGIIGGITVPVHMPLSRVGAVGWLAVDQTLDLDSVIQTHSNELRLVGYLFMEKIHRERPSSAKPFPDAYLTERELECLTWVALGKTDAEIGELINRSSSTARFHVESAVEKLGVNNRTRAAAVASQLGIISAVA